MDNSNEFHYIPCEVKNNIKPMETEQILYAQFVKIHREDLKCFATDKNKNEAKVNFQGQSSISQQWFDLELDSIEVNFSTREPDLYKNFFKATKIHKILIHSDYFKFQLEIQNVWNHLSFKMMPQSSSIVRSH